MHFRGTFRWCIHDQKIITIIKDNLIVLSMWYYRLFRNMKDALRSLPFSNLFYRPKFSRLVAGRVFIIFTIVIPTIGIFRIPQMKRRFHQQLQAETKASEIELKDTLGNLDIHMNPEDDYLVVIKCGSSGASQHFLEKSNKINELNEEIMKNPVAQQLRWVYLGDKAIYDSIGQSSIQLHEQSTKTKQDKVYLLAQEEDGTEKVLMEWGLGVPFFVINKYISRHKYKKYLRSVSF